MKIFFVFFLINAVRPVLENADFLPVVAYGCVQYLAFFLCAKIGFELFRDEGTILRFSRGFVWTVVPFLSSVLPCMVGSAHLPTVLRVMKTVEGEQYVIHHGEGRMTVLLSGLFRTPEVMGWFAMMAAILSLYLLVRSRKRIEPLLYGAMFLFSAMCSLISGRRKFFMGILVFLLSFAILMVRRKIKRGLNYLVLLAVIGGIGLFFMRQSQGLEQYYERAKSGFTETKERVGEEGAGTVGWALGRYGFLGAGIGAYAQAAGHFKERPGSGGYVEAGPGKLVGELGVPGAMAFLWLIVLYFLNVYRLAVKGRFEGENGVTAAFLAALVLTNVVEFMISHQAYGDPLIAVMTGISLGFPLALVKIQEPSGQLPSSPGRAPLSGKIARTPKGFERGSGRQ
jgi:hypothetical protein